MVLVRSWCVAPGSLWGFGGSLVHGMGWFFDVSLN